MSAFPDFNPSGDLPPALHRGSLAAVLEHFGAAATCGASSIENWETTGRDARIRFAAAEVGVICPALRKLAVFTHPGGR